MVSGMSQIMMASFIPCNKGTWCIWLSHPLSNLSVMREVPGSIPGVSNYFFVYTVLNGKSYTSTNTACRCHTSLIINPSLNTSDL